MKTLRILGATGIVLIAPLTGQVKLPPYPYEAASYTSQAHSHSLKIFPSRGNAVTIVLPYVDKLTFAPDGKSLYGFVREDPFRGGLSKIEFNPTRITLYLALRA